MHKTGSDDNNNVDINDETILEVILMTINEHRCDQSYISVTLLSLPY